MKHIRKFLIGLIILSLVIITVLLFEYSYNQNETKEQTSLSQETTTYTGDESISNEIETAPETQLVAKSYISSTLGVKFDVLEDVEVIEEGNRIYVGGKEGQYVDVLPKKISETYLSTIKNLIGPTFDQCRINTQQKWIFDDRSKDLSLPDSYSLVFSMAHESDFDRIATGQKPLCDSEYTGINGIKAFLYSNEFPEKIAFFSIGQNTTMAGEDFAWQETFRFIK